MGVLDCSFPLVCGERIKGALTVKAAAKGKKRQEAIDTTGGQTIVMLLFLGQCHREPL